MKYDYDDIGDWENDNFDTIFEAFQEEHKDLWDDFVMERFEQYLETSGVDEDELYERWRDEQR